MSLKQKDTDQNLVSDIATLTGERRASLLLYDRDGVRLVPLAPGKPVVIGRAPPSDVQVWDRKLSRQHLRVELIGNDVWVEDLKSTNGTWVNGERIQRSILKLGDEVSAGMVVLSIHVLARPREGEQPGLDNHDQFVATLEQELLRTRTFQRTLGLLMVHPARRGETHVSRWCLRVQKLLRPIDRISLFGAEMLEIVLPEATLEQTEQLAHAIVGGRRPGEPLLLCGVAVFPGAGNSAQELIEVARRAAVSAIPEEPVRVVSPGGVQVWAGEEASTEERRGPIINSEVMRELYHQVDRLAPSRIPVLIHGETGTGKEIVARAIHERSGVHDKPLRCINCGAIPDTLIESVLFGHERGAFTGANQRTPGIFEAADGGTVLLDEIGELPAPAQAALLRVLDTKRITRVGSNTEVEVDVRVLAATHRNLEAMCEEGSFRWDLLFRLNTMVLRIPPLRDRVDEIAPLAEHFIDEANRANNMHVRGIEKRALEAMQNYDWPGNVRELKNVIERAVVIAQTDKITFADLSERVRQSQPAARERFARRTLAVEMPVEEITSVIDISEEAGDASMTLAEIDSDVGEGFRSIPTIKESRVDERAGLPITFKERMQRFEAGVMLAALQRTDWNQRQAATLLHMPLRTLVYKLRAFNLSDSNQDFADPVGLEIGREVLHQSGQIVFKNLVQSHETALIRDALGQCNGNKTATARLLQIPLRTLTAKITTYDL